MVLLEIGSLESPSKSGPDTQIINLPCQGNFLLNLAKYWLGWFACLLFLPISMTGRFLEVLFALKQRLGRHDSSLEGKVVMITGASSGLGEALARAFYKEGCRLIIVSRRYSELERVRDQLLRSNLRQGIIYPPVIMELDLEDGDVLVEKVDAILSIYGYIDILVNNAGISYRGVAVETQKEVDYKVMNINYFGTVAITKGNMSRSQLFFCKLK